MQGIGFFIFIYFFALLDFSSRGCYLKIKENKKNTTFSMCLSLACFITFKLSQCLAKVLLLEFVRFSVVIILFPFPLLFQSLNIY